MALLLRFSKVLALCVGPSIAADRLRNGTGKSNGTVAADSTNTSQAQEPTNASHPHGEKEVRILHISDTHNLHLSAEERFPFPEADILLHTGDVSNMGTPAELASVNAWFGKLKRRYKHILMITGNHDWLDSLKQVHSNVLSAEDVLKPGFMAAKFPNAQVLHNEAVEVMGLRIYGSTWMPWYSMQHPGDAPVGWEGSWDKDRQSVFNVWQNLEANAGESASVPSSPQTAIPSKVDILMTHHPARFVFDQCDKGWWGSSWELRKVIEATKPAVHLFGHVHEQRGHWQRTGSVYRGGAEYLPKGAKEPFRPKPPPPAAYPVQFVSNNAMKNNAWVDKIMTGSWGGDYIAGPPRLIIASQKAGKWSFRSSP